MFAHEVALLVVVATPVATLVAMNVYAWLEGERTTLLLPMPMRLPNVELEVEPLQAEAPVAIEEDGEREEERLAA